MQNRWNPGFLARLMLTGLLLVQGAHARSITFTFDDGPDMSDNVRMTAAERNTAILKQLADAKLRSVLFLTRTDSDQRRIALVRQWGDEGHMVGNHTATLEPAHFIR